MKAIELQYGRARIPFEYDESRFDVIGSGVEETPLSDVEIGGLFDNPFDSKTIEEIVGDGETVLIVVPDATRNVGAGQILNLLVRRLIASGTMPFDIEIIFATGLHRKVTPIEREQILTPFISQRVKVFDHDPRDLMGTLRLDPTSNGIPVELNRKLVESDHVILVGGIAFHYFAGFTGGRKLVCPGLASRKTITATHALAFDTAKAVREDGVGPGILTGNPVNDAFLDVTETVSPAFLFSTFVNEQGRITGLECGHWKTSHEEACRRYAEDHVRTIKEKRGLVIVSAGGNPHDLNMVQAHKAVEMASYACVDGGTIIVLAECVDGPGSRDFEGAFELGGTSGISERLADSYSVGAQTAWSLRTKADRFKINIVTEMPEESTKKMGLQKCANLAEALSVSAPAANGYILPFGAKYLPKLEGE